MGEGVLQLLAGPDRSHHLAHRGVHQLTQRAGQRLVEQAVGEVAARDGGLRGGCQLSVGCAGVLVCVGGRGDVP